MRKLFLLILSVGLTTACVDKDYDLKDIDTDNVTIGDDESKFTIPLAKVLVTMNEIADSSANIEEIFGEADTWLPTQLPDNDTFADLQKLQDDATYVNTLLDALTAEMLADEAKLDAVADLLCKEKYIGAFLGLLPPGTTPDDFKPTFTAAFKFDAALREQLADEVRNMGRSYLTTLSVEPIDYEIGHIDISSDVVDMLADNLDPATTVDPKNTLHLEGEIANELPVTLHIDPTFSPTQIAFGVDVAANTSGNKIPPTRLFADDLRDIVAGIAINIPVTLEKYYPGKGFRDNIEHQIVIDLRLVKRGGLKLDI